MKSYIKWAGGKGQIVKNLIPRFPEPDNFNQYIEPFLGSATVFLNYYENFQGQCFSTINNKALLNDSNPMLYNLHLCVFNYYDELSFELNKLEQEYKETNEHCNIYNLKRQEINDVILNDLLNTKEEKIKASSLFIFLNKTCFNGLWRVNRQGLFNVPWNHVEKLSIYEESLLKRCSFLYKKYATFYNTDFEDFIKDNLKENDFVFLDPPYIPLNDTSSFVDYTQEGWSEQDNVRLKEVLAYIDNNNAKFLMTNSSSDKTYEMFKDWEVNKIDVHRFIKATQDERTKIQEVIITNY